jgi:small-conductance mechanosensitive channel
LSSIGLIFLVTWLLWVVLDTAIQEALKPPVSKRSSRQPSTRVKTILPLLRNAIKIILVVICAITTMANLGINVAPLLAGAGVVGLAIGFGSQQLVQDVITGLFIIIEDTLSIGDWVVLDSGHAGTVEGLTIRTLRLRDGKGFVHSVPFGQIKAVTNQSRQFAFAFFSVQFTYDTDVDKAIELIRQTGDSIREDPFLKYNLQGPLDVFGVDRMDLNGVVLTAQFRTVSGGQYAVSRAFNQRLKKLVDNSAEVHFAQTYPQQVLLPRRRGAGAMSRGCGGVAGNHRVAFMTGSLDQCRSLLLHLPADPAQSRTAACRRSRQQPANHRGTPADYSPPPALSPRQQRPGQVQRINPHTAIRLPSWGRRRLRAAAESPRARQTAPRQTTDKAPAANLATGLQPMEGAQQFAPARQPIRLALQQAPEHHAIAAQQGHGDMFQGLGRCAPAAWPRRNSAQRPASSMPPTNAPRPRRLLRAGVCSPG